jgi:hypothetical protein
MKKRELEAIHQLSKNIHVCIGHVCSRITKREQLEMLLGISNLVKRISTVQIL